MSGTMGRSLSEACILIALTLLIMYEHSIEARPQRTSTEEEICHETMKTFERVKKCPEQHSIIIQRSQMKNCSNYPMCHEKQLIYHCFRYNESFVEACAPIDRIVGHFCVLFDSGVGRILPDYNTPCPECPSVYSSNESSTYSSCVAPFLNTSTSNPVFDSTTVLDKSNLQRKPAKGHNLRTTSNLAERSNSARSTSESLVTSTRFMTPGNDTSHTRKNSSDSAEIYFTVIGSIFIMIVPMVGYVLYKIKTEKDKPASKKDTNCCLPYSRLRNEEEEEEENKNDVKENQKKTVCSPVKKAPAVQSDGLQKDQCMRYKHLSTESRDDGEVKNEDEKEAMNQKKTVGSPDERTPPVQSDGLQIDAHAKYKNMNTELGDDGEVKNEDEKEAMNQKKTVGSPDERTPPVQSDGLQIDAHAEYKNKNTKLGDDGEVKNEDEKEAMNQKKTVGRPDERTPPVQSDGLQIDAHAEYKNKNTELGDDGEVKNEDEKEAMNQKKTVGRPDERTPPVQSDGRI